MLLDHDTTYSSLLAFGLFHRLSHIASYCRDSRFLRPCLDDCHLDEHDGATRDKARGIDDDDDNDDITCTGREDEHDKCTVASVRHYIGRLTRAGTGTSSSVTRRTIAADGD